MLWRRNRVNGDSRWRVAEPFDNQPRREPVIIRPAPATISTALIIGETFSLFRVCTAILMSPALNPWVSRRGMGTKRETTPKIKMMSPTAKIIFMLFGLPIDEDKTLRRRRASDAV